MDTRAKRLMVWIGCSVLLFSFTIPQQEGHAVAESHHVQEALKYRMKDEITRRWLSYMPLNAGSLYMGKNQIYEEQPDLSPGDYKAGRLKKIYIDDGMNAVNFARYLAGLPADIAPDWKLAEQQQAAALSNAAIDQLSHYPAQVSGMQDELYQLGYKGASLSNLHAGIPTFYNAVLDYMSDSDPSNIDRVGHRRWILNPLMTKTMFGMVFSESRQYPYPYSSMYAVDSERQMDEISYDYIGWPAAGYFPTEWFSSNDAWSVSLNEKHYDSKRTDEIKVRITRERDGTTWQLDKSDKDTGGNYFTVTSRASDPFCIIFRPAAIGGFAPDDKFRVEIEGLYGHEGQLESLSYKTTFFDMVPKLFSKQGETRLEPGESFPLLYGWTGPSIPNLHPYFDTSDPSVLAVDSKGTVKALKQGVAVVMAQGYFGNSISVLFRVEEPQADDIVNAWSTQSYRLAKRAGLVAGEYDQHYGQPMDRLGYTKTAVRIIEAVENRPLAIAQSPFTDSEEAAVSKAYGYGIVNGTASSTFSPQMSITRQEAAVLMVNLYDKLIAGGAVSAPVSPSRSTPSYADDASISAWAKSSIYRAAELGLMGGKSQNCFDPAGELTREQTFVIMERLYSKLTLK